MTPIDPPPGLLDKLAEAIHWTWCFDPNRGCAHPPALPDDVRAARAAWDAMAEGLGLSEDHITTGGSPTGPVLPPGRTFRRLVSKWEPQP